MKVPIDIDDALEIGDLLYVMVRMKKLSENGERIANGIMSRLSKVIPMQYHTDPNQLEFEFVKSL
jgi:hypothetical protein